MPMSLIYIVSLFCMFFFFFFRRSLKIINKDHKMILQNAINSFGGISPRLHFWKLRIRWIRMSPSCCPMFGNVRSGALAEWHMTLLREMMKPMNLRKGLPQSMNVYDFMTYTYILQVDMICTYHVIFECFNFALSFFRHLMFTNLLGILICSRYVVHRYKTKFKQMTPRRSWHPCAVLWARQGSSFWSFLSNHYGLVKYPNLTIHEKDIWSTMVIYIYSYIHIYSLRQLKVVGCFLNLFELSALRSQFTFTLSSRSYFVKWDRTIFFQPSSEASP